MVNLDDGRYNYTAFTDQDIKDEGIRILKAVHDFCVRKKLKYSLFYGTLLGAIRHNGYIPWDDDIDIAMPRDDYEIFIREFGDEEYGVASCFTDVGYFAPFAKAYSKNSIKIEALHIKKNYVIGFNIDVFPLDYCESKEIFEKLKKKERALLLKYRCSIYKPHASKLKNALLNFFLLPFRNRYNRYSRNIDTFFSNNNKNNSKKYLVGNETNGLKTELIFDGDIFDSLVEHIFENEKFLVSSKYHSILKQRYGDYMKLPPDNQRIPHHSFTAYHKMQEGK